MKITTLADLPPELLDQIVAYIPTATSLSSLAQTHRALKKYVDQSGWRAFARTRFPTTTTAQAEDWKQVVRTLTTRSRAWDRRALMARHIEPTGPFRAYPGGKIIDKWQRPTGQTLGFTPQIDARTVVEGREATDVLAYSAGAQIVIRTQSRQLRKPSKSRNHTKWTTYRPLSAAEGRDDVTGIHLLSTNDSPQFGCHHMITGTANGDLQHISVPAKEGVPQVHTYFTTQGQPVRSTSISTGEDQSTLLAASLGNTQLALYKIDAEVPKAAPISQIDTAPASSQPADAIKNARVWSTQLLPHGRVAIGFGPSTEPIRVYEATSAGLSSTPVRAFQLLYSQDEARVYVESSQTYRKVMKTSVYPIIPVPGRGDQFFSGGYDGLVRLHDMRSPRPAELIVQDGFDDAAIYSLLLRGQETLIAGTSRHSHLKIFDARMGGKAYSYIEMTDQVLAEKPTDDFSLYLSTRASLHPHNRWRTDGSVYSLASPDSTSPLMYAGVQNGVIEIASTEILHRHPDPLYFEPWPGYNDKPPEWNGWAAKSVLNLARYEAFKVNGQKSLWDTWQARRTSVGDSYLDARWKGVKSIDLD